MVPNELGNTDRTGRDSNKKPVPAVVDRGRSSLIPHQDVQSSSHYLLHQRTPSPTSDFPCNKLQLLVRSAVYLRRLTLGRY